MALSVSSLINEEGLSGDKGFQRAVDSTYPVISQAAPHLILHCRQAAGVGDISQTLLVADIVRRHFPSVEIKVLVQLETLTKETVAQIFPSHQHLMQYVEGFDPAGHTELFSHLVTEGYVLGIAQGISAAGPIEHKRYELRTIQEYGFSFMPNKRDNLLSLGLEDCEEGLLFPTIERGTLLELQEGWLKNALAIRRGEDLNAYSAQRALYHMYQGNWYSQIASLYAVANLERESLKSIDLFLPLKYNLAQLIEWKCIDTDYLKSLGIGSICLVTPQGIEKIELGTGKEIRIFSGPIAKKDLSLIQQHAEPFFGCTGDGSLSEAIVLGKIPFYELQDHKVAFLKSWVKVAQRLDCHQFAEFLTFLNSYRQNVSEVYRQNTPRAKSWFAPPPSFELSEEGSIPRRSIPFVQSAMKTFAERMVKFHSVPEFAQEVQTVNRHLLEKYSFEQRLLSIVQRGLFLHAYPQLISTEKNLLDQFRSRQITLEEASAAIKKAIEGVLGRRELICSPS